MPDYVGKPLTFASCIIAATVTIVPSISLAALLSEWQRRREKERGL